MPFNKKLIIQYLITLWLVACISFFDLRAQHTHFSLFEQSPLYINPANTGLFSGDWRISSTYRNQWWAINSAMQSATLSYDRKFYLLNQDIGTGVYFLHDNTGPQGLTYNKIYASVAHNRFFSDHLVSFGVQVGFVNAGANGELTLPGDWDAGSGEFSPSVTLSDENLSYADINLGVLWKTSFRNLEPQAGIALSHINKPKVSFLASNDRIPVKTTFYARSKTSFGDLFVDPLVFFNSNGKAQNVLLGVDAGSKIKGNRSGITGVMGGVYVRNGITKNIDALAIHGGFSFNRFDMYINYDINISPLSQATGTRGAFEIGFVYRSMSTVLNSYSIPCNRL